MYLCGLRPLSCAELASRVDAEDSPPSLKLIARRAATTDYGSTCERVVTVAPFVSTQVRTAARENAFNRRIGIQTFMSTG